MIEDELHPQATAAGTGAKLDYFEAFEKCVKIVSAISNASHTSEKEKGLNCICFASAILDDADRIVNARKMGRDAGAAWTKSEREGVLEATTRALLIPTARK